MKKHSKTITSVLVFLFLLVFLKVDYRYINELNCCGDDFDYYSHAYTMSVDFNFDYSDLLDKNSNATYQYKDKIAPFGFFGAGLLAAPFVFIGNLIDYFDTASVVSNKVFVYSLSAIFYLFVSILLLYESLRILNLKVNIFFISLVFMGSGLAYFSFERYSMTHVYEVFTIVLIFYLIVKINTIKSTNIYIFLLPISIVLALSVRFTNYYVILLPFIYQELFFREKVASYYKSKYFISSLLGSFSIFIYINYLIYGQITFNPVNLYYGDAYRVTDYFSEVSTFSSFFLYNFKVFATVLFSQEFGIFWFNPVIVVGLFLFLRMMLKSRNNYLLLFSIFFAYAFNFALVAVWSSTASSYGFRYLLSLVPLSLIIFYSVEDSSMKKILKNYITFFSFFGLLSILFFESTKFTELSTEVIINSFGNEDLYTNPTYLSGVIKSFINVGAYMKIVATSFLFACILKFLLLFTSNITLLNFLEKFINDKDYLEKFGTYLQTIDDSGIHQFLITLLLIGYFSLQLIRKSEIKN